MIGFRMTNVSLMRFWCQRSPWSGWCKVQTFPSRNEYNQRNFENGRAPRFHTAVFHTLRWYVFCGRSLRSQWHATFARSFTQIKDFLLSGRMSHTHKSLLAATSFRDSASTPISSHLFSKVARHDSLDFIFTWGDFFRLPFLLPTQSHPYKSRGRYLNDVCSALEGGYPKKWTKGREVAWLWQWRAGGQKIPKFCRRHLTKDIFDRDRRSTTSRTAINQVHDTHSLRYHLQSQKIVRADKQR